MAQDANELRLLYMSGAVIVLSIIAIIVLALGFSYAIFYIIAIVAIIVGFYTAREISNQKVAQEARTGKRKAVQG